MQIQNGQPTPNSSNPLLANLIRAQSIIQQDKWRLKNISLPKDSTVEETIAYKLVRTEYKPCHQETVKTEILNENRKYFPYELFNTVQSLSLNSIYYTRENVLISSPTGSGKTELAILSILKEYSINKKNTRIVYLAPTKSLINQITNTLEKRLGTILQVDQETTDGANGQKTQNNKEYLMNVLVTTPERYDIITLKNRMFPTLLIIDEIHILGETRGGVVESIVIRSKLVKTIRIIGMSATIPNYRDVAEFIGAKDAHSYYFNTGYKEIPMEYTVIGVKPTGNIEETSISLLKHTIKQEPTLVFISSKKECHAVSRILGQERIAQVRRSPNETLLNKILVDVSSLMPEQEQDKTEFIQEIEKSLGLFGCGIGIHHAGMTKTMRRAVETLFLLGTISTICCTSTLSCGVNLPADNVIIFKTKSRHARSNSSRQYTLSEISQMSGRAGRKGLSAKGSVTIITEIDKIEEYSRAVTFQFPVESNLAETLHTRILYEVAAGKSTETRLVEWIKSTYAYSRGLKHKETKEYFTNPKELVRSVLEYLIGIEAVEIKNSITDKMSITDKREIIRLSTIGSVSFKYYLDPETVHTLQNIFKNVRSQELDLDVGDILLIVSTAGDYRTIPQDCMNRDVVTRNHLNGLKAVLKYPIRSQTTKIRNTIESVTEIKEIVSVLVQAHIDRREIDTGLYHTYANILTSIDRILWACLSLGRLFLNRSVDSILTLIKSVEEREWRHGRTRDVLQEIEIQIDGKIVTLINPQKCEIFFTVASSDQYTLVHTAITKKERYYYNLPETAKKHIAYKIQADKLHKFAKSVVKYVPYCE